MGLFCLFCWRCDFWGLDRFFWGVKQATAKARAMILVASPFGLRSCLRQSGSRFRGGFFGGLKPSAPSGKERQPLLHGNSRADKGSGKKQRQK
jgi:hypothetical protein